MSYLEDELLVEGEERRKTTTLIDRYAERRKRKDFSIQFRLHWVKGEVSWVLG